jgi:hypothetical protein
LVDLFFVFVVADEQAFDELDLVGADGLVQGGHSFVVFGGYVDFGDFSEEEFDQI